MSITIDTDTLAFLVADCARLMRMAFEKRISSAGLGITAGEARTLVQIAAVNGSRQLDIAIRMGLEPMTVSAFLDRLQARGLIERQPDPLDRRAKRILLSDAAEDMIRAISIEIAAVQQEATMGLDEQALCDVSKALKSFRLNLQKVEQPAIENAPITDG
ncbi:MULTISPECIES: MarR family winged helix-turn-helix transcriptional regulator [unclassified Rhizobium]|uniref:MarR family winged helix-turn-helix transcriptional regulator n=1 Tax=unclassified Rhizobium TaxID=2613769 RepID=UPI001ADCE094|nr:MULTISPECIES: MarR family winged helix-turn-helix transcriptional regulator [unclassified Rhizobium]MBO9100153.1 winged helix-turn-helix transcriptional regulator [Rhizobium sp. L58/93]MBO9135690.1 winged helix-turn-helix transcriptional regulator [Rhizobium sp. B209b/85]MBO9170119.1 winged helix-turn-helix transcriptional regulator [Rhizobium sp. L245/93]MBO9186046.1 winged helix-turn-helix transcriptional regulator [Rhizobium sp. E27B/91]QXZ82979.1 winged helix-turn-helix transcriptional 